MDYDAWGKRRTLNGASTPDSLDGTADDKGYTGHEMLDALDLVHMNGRVYDPRIARFLSADPIVQSPEQGQSYNRYSYVWNSPTNFTDPSGFVLVPHDTGKEDTQPVPTNETEGRDWRALQGNSYARGLDKGNGASQTQDGTSNGRQEAATSNPPSSYDRYAPLGHGVLAAAGGVPIAGAFPDFLDLAWTAGEYIFDKASGTDVGLAGLGVFGTIAPGADQVIAAARAGRQAERAAEVAGRAERGLWKITEERTERVVRSDFGKIYQSKSDGLWWARDAAGHGGSEWKVFRETSKGLEWYRDADKYGNFIVGKHKGDVGKFITWKDLSGSKY